MAHSGPQNHGLTLVHALDGSSQAFPENPNKPHVLLILDQFPKALGGGERIVLRMAELLPAWGYRVSILTFAIHPDSPVLRSAPCPIYLVPLQRTYDLKALRAAFAIGRFIRRQNVKIVQTFFESSDLWAGCVVKCLSRARLIWSRRDMGILRGRKHEIAYRLLARLPDQVFAVSERVRRHCIDVDGIDPARVKVIYNGLDLTHWKQSPKDPRDAGGFVVTTIGNIRPVKGHDLLVRAAATVLKRFPACSFTVAGAVLEPGYFAELLQMVQDLGLARQFHFVGDVGDLRAHLQTADIFVLPSRSEGFSNAILEAMACGLPVIATDVGGNGEAVQDGLNGFVIASEDSEALARAVLRLLDNPAEIARMGEASMKLVEERFTAEAMMRQITGAYALMLGTT